MIEVSQDFPKAFAVWFRDFARWDVKFFSSRLNSKYPLVSLQPFIKEHNEKINPFEFPENTFRILGVNNTGGVFHAYDTLGKKINQPYKKVSGGDFVYNPYRVNVGSIGIVSEELGGNFISPAYVVFSVDQSRIIPKLLELILKSKWFNPRLRASTAGSVRQNLTFDLLGTLEIPLSPRSIQQAIVNRWQNAQEEIRATTKRVSILEKSIAESALKDAGIELHPLEKRQKSFLIYWDEIERWGVEFNRWTWKLSELLLSHKYPMVVLSDETFINPTDNVLLTDDELVSFIPMEAVSDKTGEIATPQIRKCLEVKNGYTRFSNDDVIWAKITPCMQNGKCAVARDLKNGVGFGSTEFHVIRSKDKDKLMPDYIWTLLRLDHLRQAAQRYFIGSAGQQRVPADFLANLQIPRPPIEIQRTIISSVKKAFSEITRAHEVAERKSLEIKTEIEELILGTKSIATS